MCSEFSHLGTGTTLWGYFYYKCHLYPKAWVDRLVKGCQRYKRLSGFLIQPSSCAAEQQVVDGYERKQQMNTSTPTHMRRHTDTGSRSGHEVLEVKSIFRSGAKIHSQQMTQRRPQRCALEKRGQEPNLGVTLLFRTDLECTQFFWVTNP